MAIKYKIFEYLVWQNETFKGVTMEVFTCFWHFTQAQTIKIIAVYVDGRPVINDNCLKKLKYTLKRLYTNDQEDVIIWQTDPTLAPPLLS